MVDLLHPEIIKPLVDEACATKRVVTVGDINHVHIKLIARNGETQTNVVALLTGPQKSAEVSSEAHKGIVAFTDGINQGVQSLAA